MKKLRDYLRQSRDLLKPGGPLGNLWPLRDAWAAWAKLSPWQKWRALGLAAPTILVLGAVGVLRWWTHRGNPTSAEVIGLISAFLVVVGILVTLSLFLASQAIRTSEAEAQKNARLAALAAEVQVNQDVCGRLLLWADGDEKHRTRRPTASVGQFELAILKGTLASGLITKGEQLACLWSAYERMSQANVLLAKAIDVMLMGHLIDLGNTALHEARHNRINELKSHVVEQTRIVTQLLKQAEGVLPKTDIRLRHAVVPPSPEA